MQNDAVRLQYMRDTVDFHLARRITTKKTDCAVMERSFQFQNYGRLQFGS